MKAMMLGMKKERLTPGGGYDDGYNECLINKREDWINYEVEILHRIKQVFCETDEDIEEFEKLWRNGAFHVSAPKRDEGPNVKIDPHLTNVLGNATMTYPWWKKIK